MASTGAGSRGVLQTKNGFVPEQHTDFIFTAVGEDLGFVGGATLLLLFAAPSCGGPAHRRSVADFFGTSRLAGLGVLHRASGVHENIGMTMGIMPITGLPGAPFVSYGGSAMVVFFMAVGFCC